MAKLISSIPAKVIFFDTEILVAECRISNDVYQERNFDIDLFETIKLEIGILFDINLYKVDYNKQMIEVVFDETKKATENDFTEIDFGKLAKDLIFNRKLDD